MAALHSQAARRDAPGCKPTERRTASTCPSPLATCLPRARSSAPPVMCSRLAMAAEIGARLICCWVECRDRLSHPP